MPLLALGGGIAAGLAWIIADPVDSGPSLLRHGASLVAVFVRRSWPNARGSRSPLCRWIFVGSPDCDKVPRAPCPRADLCYFRP